MLGSRSFWIGKSVVFGVSDPWEFSKECGDGPFQAEVIDAEEGALALRLSKPLRFRGIEVGVLVATPRHADEGFSLVVKGEDIPINLTPGDVKHWNEGETLDPFLAAAKWRSWHLVGGLGLEK